MSMPRTARWFKLFVWLLRRYAYGTLNNHRRAFRRFCGAEGFSV
jgi:hypothetical protein